MKKISSIKVHSLASGSKGNCLLIETNGANVLVDMGISYRKLCSRLTELNMSLADISAVFITHEHKDHVSGLTTFMKSCDINVFAREQTWRNIQDWRNLRKNFCQKLTDSIVLDCLQVEPFSIPHDAADPVGFNFYYDRLKCSVLTDVGFPSSSVREKIHNADYLVLEANHDLDMLQHSHYPDYLKQRIRSNKGHLSNADAGWLLSHSIDSKNMKVMLAHLSAENNTGTKALQSVQDVLKQTSKIHKADIRVALQDQIISM